MDLNQAFGMENDRVEKIITIVERLERIDRAIDRIKYNNELFTEVPEVVRTLGAARDAAIAELKTL